MTIDEYIISHSEPESELLKKLTREANSKLLHGRMVSGHIQGRLLSAITKMIRPKNILEIGTYVGYSAICFAEGLDEGCKITTLDIDDEIEDMARRYINQSPNASKINFIVGDALQLIPQMEETFDLVFIDGDKRQYMNYYNVVFDKVPSGGFILADNTLWDGKLIQPIASNDWMSKGLIEFNDFIAKDERVERFILPLRDGLTIIRKK